MQISEFVDKSKNICALLSLHWQVYSIGIHPLHIIEEGAHSPCFSTTKKLIKDAFAQAAMLHCNIYLVELLNLFMQVCP